MHNTINASKKAKENRDEKRRIYYLNPKLCKQCQITPIPYGERMRQKFCSQTCSGIYNNSIKYGVKSPRYCKKCEKQLSSRSVGNYCVDCKMVADTEKAIEDKIPMTPLRLRKYLKRVRGHRCEECKLETWFGVPIPLDTHHLDGKWENNNLDNLKLLCKNCHAITDTYGSKNNGNGRPFTKKCKATNIIVSKSI